MADNKKIGVKKFVLTSDEVNSYGFRVLTEGCDISQFLKNPIMLFNHDRYSETYQGPVGKWNNIQVANNQITAESDFDENDELGKALASKVENDYIRACSIGLRVIETSDDPALKLPGQIYPTITKCKIQECSICDIPSNDDALVLYDADDNILELSQENLIKLFTPHSITPQKKHSMNLEQNLAIVLNLADKATAEDVTAAVRKLCVENENLKKDNATLKQVQETNLNAQIDDLIKVAKDQKKITDAQTESYKALFKQDFENTKKILESIPAAVKLTDMMQTVATDNTANKNDWKLSDWKEKDFEGLMKLKSENPEKYNALFTAEGIIVEG